MNITVIPAKIEDAFRVRMFKLAYKENHDEKDKTLRFAKALMWSMDSNLLIDTEPKRRAVMFWYNKYQGRRRNIHTNPELK